MAKQHETVDFEVVSKIARSIPGVKESISPRGVGLRFCGKLLACTAIHKSAEPNSLMIRLGADERDLLLEADPDTFYLTDHYRGHPAVLVRLPKTNPAELRDLLERAAQFVSGKKMGGSGSSG